MLMSLRPMCTPCHQGHQLENTGPNYVQMQRKRQTLFHENRLRNKIRNIVSTRAQWPTNGKLVYFPYHQNCQNKEVDCLLHTRIT